MFDLQITTRNAAFEPERPGLEVARILRDVAERLEDGHESGGIRDINGNKVGTFRLELEA